MKTRSVVVSLSGCAVLASVASAQVPYFADFGSGSAGPEWSSTSVDTAPLGEKYLGQFGAGAVTLSLGAQPAGAYVLSFDFYAIQSLDGNGPAGGSTDNFQFLANGSNLFFTNFDNFGISGQAYPNQAAPFGPGGSFAPGTGAAALNSLGFFFGGSQINDSIYHFDLAFTHAGGDLTLSFVSFQGQSVGDEGWGLDNVRVVPAPTAGLLVIGGAGLAARRRRR